MAFGDKKNIVVENGIDQQNKAPEPLSNILKVTETKIIKDIIKQRTEKSQIGIIRLNVRCKREAKEIK